MVRGAQAGATVGAVGGAIEGSSKARAEKDYQAAQEQRELDQFRHDVGDYAYDGAVALVDCNHAVEIANAQAAAKSTNSNHALAGLWLQALSYAIRTMHPAWSRSALRLFIGTVKFRIQRNLKIH
jgi:hypothetical protein